VCVYLRFVNTCAHDPVTIFADADHLACFFEAEAVEELDAIGVCRIAFQRAPALASEPFWQFARVFGARQCVHRGVVAFFDLHLVKFA